MGNMEVEAVRERVSRDDEIRELLEQGKTVREICGMLKVSPKTVCKVRREMGLTRKVRGRASGERGDEEKGRRLDEELRRRYGELEGVLKRKEEECEELRRRVKELKVLRVVCFVEALLILLLVLLW